MEIKGKEIIREDFINLDVSLNNKEEVIDFIGDILYSYGRITDKNALLKDMYMREEEASTSMGLGIAIPHAKSLAVKVSTVVFLRLETPIAWNDDTGINMVFAIVVPAKNIDNEHLKILSTLSRNLANESFRGQLLNAANKAESKKLLEGINAS